MLAKTITARSAAEEFLHICNDLDKMLLCVVAHQKKFSFAINQFRNFCESFFEHAGNDPLENEKIGSLYKINEIIQEFGQLISFNLENTWASTFLENPSISTAMEINVLVLELQKAAIIIDQEAAHAFDVPPQQWIEYHILDLTAIHTSMQQYINNAQHEDKFVPIMKQKIQSIDNFIKEYDDENNTVRNNLIFSPLPMHMQNLKLEHDDFTVESQVGVGISAFVYYGHLKSNNMEIAIKQLKFEKLKGNKLKAFQREINVLAAANHPCCLKLVGATDSYPFSIVTEWLGGGTLYHELHKYHRLDATKLTICAIDIARGMSFLHSLKIIHRDLKSLNILLNKDGFAKICDFGYSRLSSKESYMTINVGTPHWMAPEILGYSISYDEKVDVYSYGILLWEILTGRLPYDGLESNQIIGQIILNDLRPVMPSNTPPEFRKLIEMCWVRDPRERPSFEEILKIWRTGNIMLPGAQPQVIQNHLMEITNEIDTISEDIETQLTTNPYELSVFYQTLLKDGIPDKLAEKLWNHLQSLPRNGNNELFIKCVSLFLYTSMIIKAAQILRAQPHDSIPRDIAVKASQLIPTGNEKLDMDLLMIACKNHSAIEAALHSIQKDHIMIALEVIAREGMSTYNRDQICARCVQCLSISHPMLNTAALRCLIANNETKRIPLRIIKMHMQSPNMTLKMATFIAAAKMAEEGIQIPNEILDIFIAKWDSVPIAGTALLHACKNLESARYVLNKLSNVTPPMELALRIIIQINTHPELRNAAQAWLYSKSFSKDDVEVSKVIKLLTE